jgi:hypothetical protein
LALLPVWYAEDGDYVCEGMNLFHIGADGPLPVMERAEGSLPPLHGEPWGLSPAACRFFGKLQARHPQIQAPQWDANCAVLAGRKTAASCLQKIREACGDKKLPEMPRFFSSPEEALAYLREKPGAYLLKTPYSSSGRGLLSVNGAPSPKDEQWMRGAFARQKALSVEQRLERVLDFALEYKSDGRGGLEEEGLSLFRTSSNGAYRGNILQTQDKLREQLRPYLEPSYLKRMSEILRQALADTYAHLYAGPLGLDLLVYKDAGGNFRLHPCVEVNLRRTMGHLALRLQERLAPGSEGLFQILYHKQAGEALNWASRMKEEAPLRLRGGRPASGCLFLTPINASTCYTASVQIFTGFPASGGGREFFHDAPQRWGRL